MQIPDGMFMGHQSRWEQNKERDKRKEEINKKKAKQSFAKAHSKRKKNK